MRILQNQKGNALLFFLICIPVVFSFAILVVDVSRYQGMREDVQSYADQLVLQAAKFLPNTKAVEAFIQSQSKQGYKIVNIELASNAVSISLQANVDSLFDLFLKTFVNKENRFYVNEHATAVVSPVDLVIIMQDGLNLRPTVKNLWGNAADWPKAHYFNSVSAPESIEMQIVDDYVWPQWWKEFSQYSAWATQACFNPVFSAIKSFVISLTDNFSLYKNSRIAVISVPGDDPLLGYSLISSFNQTLLDNKLTYWEQENYLSDELCALISLESRYRIFSERESLCPELFVNKNTLHYPHGLLTDCVKRGDLSTREAIYYRSTRKYLPSQAGIFAAFHSALAQIASPPSGTVAQERANLLLSAKKEVIFLTDRIDFDVASLASFWNNFEQLNVRLSVIPFYSSDDLAQRQELDNAVRDLQSLDWLRVFNPSTAENLIEKILPNVIEANQQIVLKN